MIDKHYYTTSFKAKALNIKVILGNPYTEELNPAYKQVTEKNLIHSFSTFFEELIGDKKLAGEVTIRMETLQNNLYAYKLSINYNGQSFTACVQPYPACCGSSLVWNFAHNTWTSQTAFDLMARAVLTLGIISPYYWGQVLGVYQSNRPLRFNAILVNHGRNQDGFYRDKWTDAVALERVKGDRNYPRFHNFVNNSCVLEGSVPFYNPNSGNICTTVVARLR